MKIDLKELRTCGVPAGSDVIELGFVDAAGTAASLRIPFGHAQALLMTLPRLLAQALRHATSNPESRFVFPLGGWQLEAATEQACIIATFETEDGFKVSFGIPPEACEGLGWALKREGAAAAQLKEDRGERAPCLN